MDSKPHPTTEPITPSSQREVTLRLRVIDGPDFGKELVAVSGTYVVGKGPTSALVLADPAVSRSHLLVEVLPTRLRIKDLDSSNGSTCNGMPFTMLEAEIGAELRIGRTTLKVLGEWTPAPRVAPSTRTRFHGLVGRSLAVRTLFAELERVARADVDVLLQGETGTGKEICARAIHDESARAKGPFVTYDLASAAHDLFESEVFGHVKGAFTNAVKDHEGAAARAHEGTLFLDEVGELPLELQPKLLRLLDSRQLKPVGGSEVRSVDIRIVAATPGT